MILMSIKFIFDQLSNLFFFHDEWNVGVWKKPIIESFVIGERPKLHWLPRDKIGNFKADPFGIDEDGNLYVFLRHTTRVKVGVRLHS